MKPIIPKVISDIWLTPTHEHDAVHEVMGQHVQETPNLTSRNAAIYIGKIYSGTIWRKIMDILLYSIGTKPDSKIYNERFMAATLGYAFQCTPPGEKVRIVICRSLSEIFNGKNDVQGTYSVLEEKKWIVTVALRHFRPEKRRNLEMVAMDEVPENVVLFKHLQACIAEGKTKPEEIFATDNPIKISKNSNALEIAQFLFAVCQKPENQWLKKKFAGTRPQKVKKKQHSELSEYYGLAEVAMRLRAILSGQFIHSGAGRQDLYDKIILAIVEGRKKGIPKKGRQKSNFEKAIDLYPLYELFEENPVDGLAKATFETVHVDTEENFYEQTYRKDLARTRAFFGGCVLAILTTIGAYECYHYRQDGHFVPIHIHFDIGRFQQDYQRDYPYTLPSSEPSK